MRYLLALAALLCGINAVASDYGREQKWADEVLPGVLTGDPVWLNQGNGHKFLGLYTPADPAKAALVVVHGIGVHPDWGLISGLRQELPAAGYATLSIQMPVLRADAKSDEYPPTFDDAAERLKLAVVFLKDKGYAKVAVVAHSLGARMSYHYLSGADTPVAAWVAIGAPAALDTAKLGQPILDIYGQNDLPQVISNGKARAQGLKHPKSAQIVVPGADHFFNGKDADLQKLVRDWLDQSL